MPRRLQLSVYLWGAECDVRNDLVLRLFNVFGPGEQPYRLFPSLVERLGRGETVPLSVAPRCAILSTLSDVCLAMLMTLHAMQGDDGLQGVFNVASGVAVSVADFAHTVARVLRVSDALAAFSGALPLRPGDLPFVVGDPSRLMATSGWHPLVARSGMAYAHGRVRNARYVRRIKLREGSALMTNSELNGRKVPLVSISIPVLNEADNIDRLYDRLTALADRTQGQCDLEFVFSDNHSSDETWKKLTALAARDARVRAVRLRETSVFSARFSPISCTRAVTQ